MMPKYPSSTTGRNGSLTNMNVSSCNSATDCPICCSIFRTPKCLPCGHSICSSCCQKLLRSDTQIQCPTCRHVTRVPSEGLPTNYALQDTVNQLASAPSTANVSKPYKCEECGRLCSADDSWLCRRPQCLRNKRASTVQLCSRCVISRHADHGSGSSKLESISENLMKYENIVTDLKRKVDIGVEKHGHRDHKVRKLVVETDSRLNNLVAVCKGLMQSALDDAKNADEEYSRMQRVTTSLNVYDSGLETLSEIDRLVQDAEKKLKDLDLFEQKALSRAENLLNSLSIELDCLIRIGNGENDVDEEVRTPIVDNTKQAKMGSVPVQATVPLLAKMDTSRFTDGYIGDDGRRFSTPAPREHLQRTLPAPAPAPPPPPAAPMVRSHRNEQSHHANPLASSSAYDLNVNFSHHQQLATPIPRAGLINSSMYGCPDFLYGNTTRRGPRSTISAAGMDFKRQNNRYGYKK